MSWDKIDRGMGRVFAGLDLLTRIAFVIVGTAVIWFVLGVIGYVGVLQWALAIAGGLVSGLVLHFIVKLLLNIASF